GRSRGRGGGVMRASARPLALGLMAAAAGTGCGLHVELPDLFLVTRTGGSSKLTLVVNDGGQITCNDGKQKTITSSQLITARDLTDDLANDAKAKLAIPSPSGTVYTYTVKLQQGTISFPDRAATTHKYLGQVE